jgi:hypothetical protein
MNIGETILHVVLAIAMVPILWAVAVIVFCL